MAASRTMAGNWERSEGVPVGRATLKTRTSARLTEVDTGPPPWAGGTGLFKNRYKCLLFEVFFVEADSGYLTLEREGRLRRPAG